MSQNLPTARGAHHLPIVLNIVSIVIGLIAALLAIPAFIPLLGIINWLVLPVAFVGLIVGTLSSRRAGFRLNLVVLIVAGVRLMLGGGLI